MSGTNNPLIVKNRLQPGFITYIRLKGWDVHDYHISFTKERFQVCMEFCLTDFCVGVYYKSETGMWDLIETKESIEDFTYAFLKATELKHKVEHDELPKPKLKTVFDKNTLDNH
jgi:hypothetical protein